jgi:hypothetical protein
MNLGMIGLAGGVGKGFLDESAHLKQVEDEDRADQRTMTREKWLMQQREQYAVAAEGRAETRTKDSEVRAEDRRRAGATWDTDRKIADAPRIKKAESDAAYATVDQDAEVAKRLAEGKQTDAEREEKESRAEYNRANASYTLGAKSDLVGNKAESAELKAVRDERRALQGEIDKAKLKVNDLDGTSTWNPAKNPEHKALDDRLRGLTLRERTMSSGRGTGGAAMDPQGKRGPATGGGAAMYPTERSMKGEGSNDIGADPAGADREIAATERGLTDGTISNPEDQANARGYVADLRAQRAKLPAPGMAGTAAPPVVAAAPRPAAAAVAPASPPGEMKLPPSLLKLPRSLDDTPGARVNNIGKARDLLMGGDLAAVAARLRAQAGGGQTGLMAEGDLDR